MYSVKKQGGSIIILREQLLKEQKRLAHIIEVTKKRLENVPEGTLRIGKSQGCFQYYHCTKEKSHNGVYLPKKEIELARRLAQKSYDAKVLRYAEKTHSQISRLLKNFQDEKLEQIYYSENSEKQKLIVPVEDTYEQKIKKWLSIPHTGKPFNDDAPVIMTNNGIRVRSKSEKIMADYFESRGLKYKYECSLVLKPYGTIYPDFTFLSRRTGEEVYWEHEGMMDSPEYARAAVKKIELYAKNGIYPGERLILTFETSTDVVSTEMIKCLIDRYLI